jgi:hypothetical protein
MVIVLRFLSLILDSTLDDMPWLRLRLLGYFTSAFFDILKVKTKKSSTRLIYYEKMKDKKY